jgi:hypothetical protein
MSLTVFLSLTRITLPKMPSRQSWVRNFSKKIKNFSVTHKKIRENQREPKFKSTLGSRLELHAAQSACLQDISCFNHHIDFLLNNSKRPAVTNCPIELNTQTHNFAEVSLSTSSVVLNYDSALSGQFH